MAFDRLVALAAPDIGWTGRNRRKGPISDTASQYRLFALIGGLPHGNRLDCRHRRRRNCWLACRAVHEERHGTLDEHRTGNRRSRCCQLAVQLYGVLIRPRLGRLFNRRIHRRGHPDLYRADGPTTGVIENLSGLVMLMVALASVSSG